MIMQTSINVKTGRVTELSARKKFGKYKDEEQKAVRKADVKEDKIFLQLVKAWGEYGHGCHRDVETLFMELQNAIKDISCSAQDIERFTLALVGFTNDYGFDDKAGFFLTALINKGKDRDYVIHTEHLVYYVPRENIKRTVNFLGCCETKKITVKGDIGAGLGYKMTGGTIIVEGNGGYDIGMLMEGGEIHINGEYKSISETMKHGKIYHKGKLIVEK